MCVCVFRFPAFPVMIMMTMGAVAVVGLRLLIPRTKMGGTAVSALVPPEAVVKGLGRDSWIEVQDTFFDALGSLPYMLRRPGRSRPGLTQRWFNTDPRQAPTRRATGGSRPCRSRGQNELRVKLSRICASAGGIRGLAQWQRRVSYFLGSPELMITTFGNSNVGRVVL